MKTERCLLGISLACTVADVAPLHGRGLADLANHDLCKAREASPGPKGGPLGPKQIRKPGQSLQRLDMAKSPHNEANTKKLRHTEPIYC